MSHSDPHKYLVVSAETCPTAHERSNKWQLTKGIIVPRGERLTDKLKVCLFEGDVAEVAYELTGKRSHDEIFIMWSVTIKNHGHDRTHDLRVGFMITDDDSKTHRTYKGFETQHPVIEAGGSETYCLTGTLDCHNVKKLLVTTKDLIYDDDHSAVSIKALTKVSESACEDSFVLVDSTLDFEKEIQQDETFVVNALYEMDDNVRDNTSVINTAEIIGKTSGVVAKNCAEVYFFKSELSLDCPTIEDEKHSEWCLGHSSDIVYANDKTHHTTKSHDHNKQLNTNTNVKYMVYAQTIGDEKRNSVILTVELTTTGCLPRYAKPFVVSVYGVMYNGDRKLLKKDSVTLGGECGKWKGVKVTVEGEKQLDYILVVVTTKRIIYVVAKGIVKSCDDIDIIVAEKKIPHNMRNNHRVSLRNDLCSPYGSEWRINNKGTFPNIESLEKWLNGCEIDCLGTDRTILSWTLTWSGESIGTIKNSVILTNKQSKIVATSHSICLDEDRHTRSRSCDPIDSHHRDDSHLPNKTSHKPVRPVALSDSDDDCEKNRGRQHHNRSPDSKNPYTVTWDDSYDYDRTYQPRNNRNGSCGKCSEHKDDCRCHDRTYQPRNNRNGSCGKCSEHKDDCRCHTTTIVCDKCKHCNKYEDNCSCDNTTRQGNLAQDNDHIIIVTSDSVACKEDKDRRRTTNCKETRYDSECRKCHRKKVDCPCEEKVYDNRPEDSCTGCHQRTSHCNCPKRPRDDWNIFSPSTRFIY